MTSMKSENELVPDKVESDPIAHYQTLHKSQGMGSATPYIIPII